MVILVESDNKIRPKLVSLGFQHRRMKRFLSILLAWLLLTSGMHLSVASHYCGGSLAQVKWSFNRALAGCGMEDDHEAAKGIQLEQPCCQDQLSTYTTDGYYQFQSLELKKFTPKIVSYLAFATCDLFKSQQVADHLHTPVFPPGENAATQVFQEDICVFRI